MRSSFRPWQARLLCPVLLTLLTLVPGGARQPQKPKGPVMLKERATLRVESSSGADVVFSPDGKSLASFGDYRTVKLWEVVTLKERAAFRGQSIRASGDVLSLAYAPDGKTLACGYRDTIKLWDVAAG